jgi:hypothetical protein
MLFKSAAAKIGGIGFHPSPTGGSWESMLTGFARRAPSGYRTMVVY